MTTEDFRLGGHRRLHERALITDPRSRAKSVALTDEGTRLAKQLFTALFGVQDAGPTEFDFGATIERGERTDLLTTAAVVTTLM